MPIVAISVARLNELLGKDFEMETLVHGMQQLGCDVEDTATLALYKCPACDTPNDKLEREDPPKRCDFCGYESAQELEKYAGKCNADLRAWRVSFEPVPKEHFICVEVLDWDNQVWEGFMVVYEKKKKRITDHGHHD